MSSSFLYLPTDEQNSIAARLIELFKIPEKTVFIAIPIDEQDNIKRVPITMRLLNDMELQEVTTISESYPGVARLIVGRREKLARAISSIDGQEVTMPPSIKSQYISLSGGKDPSKVEERSWVFRYVQPSLLELFDIEYEKILKEQRDGIMELKKKLEEQPNQQEEMQSQDLLSSLQSVENLDGSSNTQQS